MPQTLCIEPYILFRVIQNESDLIYFNKNLMKMKTKYGFHKK